MSKRKFYAVVTGYKAGIYDEWFGIEGAEAQIKGFPNAVYKSFATLADAEAWYTKIAGNSPLQLPELSLQTLIESLPLNPIIDPAMALQEGKVVIYTDGACEGNPGPGGYGVVLCYKENRKEISGGFALTTNNRMELMAVIMALQTLKGRRSVTLYCDSSYVVNGIQKGWATKWRGQDWKRKEKKDLVNVKNADLWKQLLELCEAHDIEFVQVPGHAGVAENERCDTLAVRASQQTRLPTDTGYDAPFAENNIL